MPPSNIAQGKGSADKIAESTKTTARMDKRDNHEIMKERESRVNNRRKKNIKQCERPIGATHAHFSQAKRERPIEATIGSSQTGVAQKGTARGEVEGDDSGDGRAKITEDEEREDSELSGLTAEEMKDEHTSKYEREDRGSKGWDTTTTVNSERPIGASHASFRKARGERPIGETPGSSPTGAA